jgi:protein-tyrosine phosphatase
MTQVWERLFIGGLSDAEELAEGNPLRITTVVSLTEIPVEAKRKGVNYVHVPIADDEPVPFRQFTTVMDAIAKSIRKGNPLLHCGVGVSRAPSLAAAYMDAVGCMGVETAIGEIRKLRPVISPSTVLINSLKENLR